MANVFQIKTGMKVFISGASGLLGGNCLQYFTEMGWKVVGSHLSFATPKTVFYNTLEPNNPENYDVEAFQHVPVKSLWSIVSLGKGADRVTRPLPSLHG